MRTELIQTLEKMTLWTCTVLVGCLLMASQTDTAKLARRIKTEPPPTTPTTTPTTTTTTTTTPPPTEPPYTGLTAQQKQDMVNKHNELRREVGASNMRLVRWYENLAYAAEKRNNRCNIEHWMDTRDRGAELDAVVQNIWAISGYDGPFVHHNSSVETWYSENRFITVDHSGTRLGCQADQVCGHYYAMTHHHIEFIGCAAKLCTNINAWVVTCHYSPFSRAYSWDMSSYYRFGPPCSECDEPEMYCREGLCDRACSVPKYWDTTGCSCRDDLFCYNGGTFFKSNCSCECPEKFTGSRCEVRVPCLDVDSMCPYYSLDNDCINLPRARRFCPERCKLCGPEDVKYYKYVPLADRKQIAP